MRIKLLTSDQLRLGDLTVTIDDHIGIIFDINFLVKSEEYEIVRLYKSGCLTTYYYGKHIKHTVYRS